MDAEKRGRLEAAGSRVGDAADFLGLSEAESALVNWRLALSAGLKRNRTRQRLSQAAVARMIHSSQSRVAKMEAGDPSVSTDLLLRALFATGTRLEEIGEVIAGEVEPHRMTP